MPNYLVLVDKKTGTRHENRGLIAVDERLCKAFKVPCDDNQFYLGWVDWMSLYLNDDWEGVRKMEKETGFTPDHYEKRKKVLDWLEKHYNLAGYYMTR